jgi:integrase/recombinase XerC
MGGDVFLHYLRYEKNYSPHTVVAYKKDLEDFFEYLQQTYGIDQPGEVKADMIRSWMVCLLEKNISSRSVHRKLSCLKTYWHFLMAKGWVTSDPVKHLSAPKLHKELPSFLKKEEMEKLAGVTDKEGTFEGRRDGLILELFYQTGIRLSELISLTDEAVDLNTCQLKVSGTRNKQRIIPFGNHLRQRILSYLEFRAKVVGDTPSRFFVRPNGMPLYPQLVYRMVNHQLSQVTTLTKRSPHVLRHTFATILLNEGAELNAVKELLGHSSLSATEVYTHTTYEELKRVYKRAHPRA